MGIVFTIVCTSFHQYEQYSTDQMFQYFDEFVQPQKPTTKIKARHQESIEVLPCLPETVDICAPNIQLKMNVPFQKKTNTNLFRPIVREASGPVNQENCEDLSLVEQIFTASWFGLAGVVHLWAAGVSGVQRHPRASRQVETGGLARTRRSIIELPNG